MANLASSIHGANTSKLEPPCGTVPTAWKPSMVASTQRSRFALPLQIGKLHMSSKTLNSDLLQAPEHMKRHLRDVCMRLSLGSSKVLKEISSSVKSMKESRSIQVLVGEMNDAVEELQVALRSLPKQLTQSPAAAAAEAATIEKRHCVPATTISLMEVMPLFTAASLLIEVSERVGGVVDAVGTLATLACFEPIDHKKPSSSVVPRDEESVKPSQEV